MKLLDELESFFLENGVYAVYLEVREDNKGAIKLYRRKGYKKTQSLQNYYSKGTHGFIMEKKLQE